MATIRAHCDDCGDLQLTSADITVRVCSADSQGSYSFSCPECNLVTVKRADPKTVELLVTSGTRLVTWHLPQELDERPRDEVELTHDELIDFHHALEGDHILGELSGVSIADPEVTRGTDSPHVPTQHGILDLMQIHLSLMRDTNPHELTIDLLEDELRRRRKDLEDGPAGDIKNV